ncbi:PD-(D/E)XK nuclease family protein [Paenibacillus sp. R14(2021)]|uniref:PD-(D/E)XK nuclease family protein n=1 Tax=Paenibacillus sp. R14(2021) TaxID=2859228 RepID=UPI001C6120F4|nr:PD-(D/E)XK nuclease family protein [Paenibacillus sp. R14(2021)]
MTGGEANNYFKTIQHIAPSRYYATLNCALQEVFCVSGIQGMLPESPNTYFGKVAHRLLETASNGQTSEDQLEQIWESILKSEERSLQETGFAKHLVPLKNNVRLYEVKKRLVFKTAVTLISRKGHHVSPVQSRSEFNLSSSNGLINGVVDRLTYSSNGCEIIDYKTGEVIDKVTSKVKQSYQYQMKLYASSYYTKFGEWPISLRIQTLSGLSHEIRYTPQECIQLLKQAEYLIERINRTITTSQNTNEIEEQLGNPSPANCVNCTYRHQCKPYWNRRAISRRDDWPNDVQGMYIDVQHLGNNKGLLKLLWKGSMIKIRGLDLERHNISAGSLICAYGLLRDDVAHSYSEGLLTTIYS